MPLVALLRPSLSKWNCCPSQEPSGYFLPREVLAVDKNQFSRLGKSVETESFIGMERHENRISLKPILEECKHKDIWICFAVQNTAYKRAARHSYPYCTRETVQPQGLESSPRTQAIGSLQHCAGENSIPGVLMAVPTGHP